MTMLLKLEMQGKAYTLATRLFPYRRKIATVRATAARL